MTFEDMLRSYQAECVDFVASRGGCLVALEQGTGKTFVVAGLIERCVRQDDVSTHLVVSLLANVETTWARVLARLEGASVYRDWPAFRDSRDPHKILLLHYEAFRGNVVRRIIQREWTTVSFDESQRLKARGSKASRAAARFRSVRHRLALSGTPLEQQPQDLWAQLRFASPDTLGRSWTEFEQRWLRPCGFMGYDREFRWQLMPQFLRAIAPVVFRLTKEEVLDLPPIRYTRSVVPLLGEQARVYEELDRDGVTRLRTGERVICDMEITELVKLQQIAGGFILLGDTRRVVRLGDAKRRRLARVLRSRRGLGPAVIFCKFKEEVVICQEVVETMTTSSRIATVTGRKGRRKALRQERVETIDRFQRGEIDYLICQVRTGGVGIDLFASHLGVFYSLPHSSIEFDQAVSRIHRSGQTHAVEIVTLEAANTVDVLIASALLSKRSVSQQVLDDHRKKRRRHPVMAKPEPKKEDKKDKPAPAKAETTAGGEAKGEGKETNKKTAPPQPPKPKYGVPELATALEMEPTSVRVKLRQLGIPKNGKVYGWDTKDAMGEVIAKIKASKKSGGKPAKPEKSDEDEDDGDESDGD